MMRTSSTVARLRSIEKISRCALATILIPQCACCRQAHQLPSRLCAACLASLRSHLCPRSIRLPNDRACNYSQTKDSISITGVQYVAGISQLQSIFFYRDVVPDLLIRWKYDGMVELTNLIASWVANYCQILVSYDLVTIVPCHWRRRLTRGFDPGHFRTVCSVKGKRILIIDDVITSGTTLRAAAAALRHDGAAEVSALTVATARELLLPTSRTRV